MQARLHYNSATDYVEFWFYEETPNGDRRLVRPVGDLVIEPWHPGTAASPTLTLPKFQAHKLLKSLATQIREFGVKPEDESKLAGKLEATERHLDDVRKWFDLAHRTWMAGGLIINP